MKKGIIYAVIATTGIVAVLAVMMSAPPSGGQPLLRTQQLQIGEKVYTVEIAASAEERTNGLSGRKGLPQRGGMFFLFPQPDRYGFWMKDMLFPLDMVWVSPDWKVIDITKGITPESYPSVVTPPQPIIGMIELASGGSIGINLGDQVKILTQ